MTTKRIASSLAERQRPREAVLDLIEPDSDVIVGLGNGEPVTVLDAIEEHADVLTDVRLHQMLPLRDRRYVNGELPGLRHVSWFLSPHDREAFHRGACDLVPNNFSEVPSLMRRTLPRRLVVAAVSTPDAHGYFSLGPHAEYVASFIGEARFFVEVNRQMPRTFGENQLHVSEVEGWCEADYPLVELPERPSRATDAKIAELVAERIPDGATLQAGIGTIPDLVLGLLTDHRDLGVHTELLGEGFVELVECGAVNATLEVDFLGQCASESLGSDYWSSTGGQADFARGAVLAEQGQAFIVLHSTTADETVSRIVPQLRPGAAVTTFKNIVDQVVTEYGVAELRGRSIRERTRRLIDVAHPSFRESLERSAREMGYL